MSVSNYKISCSYLEEGLSKDIYLVSKAHTKVVWVDDEYKAEITNLSEAPLHISCNSVELQEESSLDERYSFKKTLTASVNGYANLSSLSEKYYAIVKTKGGLLLMVNVDFPSEVTYTYTLSDSSNSTVFTFNTLSNFPSLRLTNAFSDTINCKVYNVPCVKGLKLVETESALYSNTMGRVVLYGDTFKDIDIYGKSLVFTETFNGRDVNTNISFNLPLWYYKTYWHVNLLEFKNNKYRAVIEGCDGNYIYAGFNTGLIPSFTLNGNDENSNISVSLTETSLGGSYFSDTFNPDGDTATTWSYVLTVNGVSYYDCSEDEDGVGIYLLMAEERGNGIRTGRYKVLEGHENEFSFLNVIGTFDDIVTFPNSDCGGGSGGGGEWYSDIYVNIGECKMWGHTDVSNWSITAPNGWSINPSSGNANVHYDVEICNLSAPVGTYDVRIGCCGTLFLNSVNTGSTSIQPKSVTINCNRQNVTFSFNSSCPITVTSMPSGLTYTLGNSTLSVSVPQNSTTSARTFSIGVKDCRNATETVYIYQNGIYERWAVVPNEYVCQNGNKYERERRYTGTTNTNYVATNQYRAGTLIESGSTACSGSEMYRWYFDGRYYCDGTTKYQALLEQVSYDSGVTWTYTGNAKYGDNMGTDGTFCDGTETYTWTPTTNYECYTSGSTGGNGSGGGGVGDVYF